MSHFGLNVKATWWKNNSGKQKEKQNKQTKRHPYTKKKMEKEKDCIHINT